jgi:hypothetical protein
MGPVGDKKILNVQAALPLATGSDQRETWVSARAHDTL